MRILPLPSKGTVHNEEMLVRTGSTVACILLNTSHGIHN